MGGRSGGIRNNNSGGITGWKRQFQSEMKDLIKNNPHAQAEMMTALKGRLSMDDKMYDSTKSYVRSKKAGLERERKEIYSRGIQWSDEDEVKKVKDLSERIDSIKKLLNAYKIVDNVYDEMNPTKKRKK